MERPTFDEMTERGHVTWHSSEDDGPPDCGYSVGMGDGRMLYIGEMPSTSLNEDPGAALLGSDGGWWMVVYEKNRSRVIGKVVDQYAADELVQLVCASLENSKV